MTILDCCIGLKQNLFFLVVLGVVDMRQLLLRTSLLINECRKCLAKSFQLPALIFKFSERLSLKTERNEICLCALGTFHILRR